MSKLTDTQLGELAVEFMHDYNLNSVSAELALLTIQAALPYEISREEIVQRIDKLATRHIENE